MKHKVISSIQRNLSYLARGLGQLKNSLKDKGLTQTLQCFSVCINLLPYIDDIKQTSKDVFKLSKYLTLETALLAKELDLERGLLAIGMSKEQLLLAKKLDYQQLKEAVQYYESKSVPHQMAPMSLLSFDVNPKLKKLEPLKVLLLADTAHQANVVQDYINAFTMYSENDIHIWNPKDTCKDAMGFSLSIFDVVIIHYSIIVLFDYFLPQYLREAITKYQGIKVQIIQDEYRWINRMASRMELLGIHILISSLAPENIKKVYHHYGLASVQKYHSLPGYIPQYLMDQSLLPMAQRAIHLGYRGCKLSSFYGSVSREKSIIGPQVLELAKGHSDLKIDISCRFEDRLYGDEWTAFLKNSKAVLAVEGGVNLFDFDDTALFKGMLYDLNNPVVDSNALYQEVLKDYDNNIVHRTITPRVFEAICLKTALVLYKGRYSDILIPWKHYIPLEKDASNIEEVFTLLRDDKYLSQLTENAYNEIAKNENYHFKSMVRKIDKILMDFKCTRKSHSKEQAVFY